MSSKKAIVNGEEVEIEEETDAQKAITFFKSPEKVKEGCAVDEAYLSAYEEMKQDEKTIKENLETMNAAIKAARMGTEKTLTIGKMVAKFTDVEGAGKVDWKRLVEEQIGKVDPATLAKYTTPGKPQVRVEVIRLG